MRQSGSLSPRLRRIVRCAAAAVILLPAVLWQLAPRGPVTLHTAQVIDLVTKMDRMTPEPYRIFDKAYAVERLCQRTPEPSACRRTCKEHFNLP